jgi:hypothetical protein
LAPARPVGELPPNHEILDRDGLIVLDPNTHDLRPVGTERFHEPWYVMNASPRYWAGNIAPV